MIAGTATRNHKHNISRKHNKRNANMISGGAGSLAVSSPAGASLGNKGNLASRTKKSDEWRKRYRLQATARALLPEHKSLQCCLRHMKRGVETATIESNGERAKLTGAHRCNYGYICPVCAPRIAMAHAKELAAAVTAAYKKGWKVYHVTYTVSHHPGTTLDEVLSSIAGARRKYFTAGRGYQDLSNAAGIQGSARALEVTHGNNGWHPHFHELLFCSGDAPDNFETSLSERWIASLAKVGAFASPDHAVRVEEGSQHISEYLNKFGQLPIEGGHSIEMELSHGHTKIARKGGKSPFALLDAARQGNPHAGQLFVEYSSAMAGRAIIRWSKGLRAALDMPDEISEGDDLSAPEFVPVAALTKAALIEISDNALLPAVLAAAVAGFPVLQEVLACYDINPHPRIAGLFIRGRLGDLHTEVWT